MEDRSRWGRSGSTSAHIASPQVVAQGASSGIPPAADRAVARPISSHTPAIAVSSMRTSGVMYAADGGRRE
ncbi:MAG: hypothetical protein ACRDP9_29645 [Kribbellaceae bacterium]